MPLATKNGSLIVKDGKLAEGCGCCGWYCYSPDMGACCDTTQTGSQPTCEIAHECDCVGENKFFRGTGTTCCDNPQCGQAVGFRAFDGSNRYYKRLGFYDIDCCYLADPKTISNPDDGYYVLERKRDGCGCYSASLCIVVESARYYALAYPVGTTISLPVFWPILNANNSATWISLVRDHRCCNADGSRIYAVLTEEVSCPP